MPYSDQVHDNFHNKSQVGTLDKNDPNVGTGLVGAPACGDVMKLQIAVNPDGTIKRAVVKSFGCGAAIAASSYAAKLLEGAPLDDAMQITNKQIAEHLQLPPVKFHCSCLAEQAIKAAVEDLRSKQRASRIAAQQTDREYTHELRKETDSDSEDMFHISKEAADYLKQSGIHQYVIGIVSRGCSGSSYTLQPAQEQLALQFVSQHGVTIYVEAAAELLVIGMCIEYESRDDWEGLVFKNPNAVDQCQCGESFFTKTQSKV